MSKKAYPFLFSEYTMDIGQEFSDILYNQETYLVNKTVLNTSLISGMSKIPLLTYSGEQKGGGEYYKYIYIRAGTILFRAP